MSQITPKHRVVVWSYDGGDAWLWKQVNRNGVTSAVAPRAHRTKANAVRSARRQVEALNWGFEHWLPVGERSTDPGRAVLIIE